MVAQSRKKTILVVDDDEALAAAIKIALESEGFRVITAPNGRDALDLMLQGNGNVDLIILDLYMPSMNGWQFAYYLKKHSSASQKNIPIIITSSIDSQLGKDAASSFQGYLQKPVVFKMMIEMCKQLCRKADNYPTGAFQVLPSTP